MAPNARFSDEITVFREYTLPESATYLAGYAALIHVYNLDVPLPSTLSAISHQHRKFTEGKWRVYTIRHKPEESLGSHLAFALKYEGVELLQLTALFKKIDPREIVEIIRAEPTGQYPRRIWFLYEWLMNRSLPIQDLQSGNYVDAIDTRLQYGGASEFSKRHRVRNNLPGVREFCPLVRKTERLETWREQKLDEDVKEALKRVHKDLVSRAAAFLLLKDSKASFAIEGEQPQQVRTEQWGQAIGQAGQEPLTLEELLRLQTLVIPDNRFVTLGLRKEGGFVGMHDRVTRTPIPDHISAKWEDLPNLMDGWIQTNNKLERSSFDPVIAAAMLSFGFVFIHPFEDGNGRIHRYIIHHVLSRTGFAPKGFVFPVSAVMLERIDEYRHTLESYSRPLLKHIEWNPTPNGNVDVRNNTADFYRYFDATAHAEFLYQCVQQTVHETLPEEMGYLKHHDAMKSFIEYHFDMPDKTIETLIGFLHQQGGSLSKRARKREFEHLTDDEVSLLESTYDEIFDTE